MLAGISKVTVLSVLVDASLGLPAKSVATPAPSVATTVPVLVIPLTDTPQSVPPRPIGAIVADVAPAVPPRVTPSLVKPNTGLLKTTRKKIGDVTVGSSCPGAWLIRTVNG